jgi:carbonic anhydrase
MKDIARFLSGFRTFQQNYFCAETEYFARLRERQSPKALVVACCDSRVDPALLMGCEPGDIFVVRNVANLVPPYDAGHGLHGVSAALEYGVRHLAVEHIIVLGHSSCGGIGALMRPDGGELGEFIGPWVGIAREAVAEIQGEFGGKPEAVRQRGCEMAAVLVSIGNLLTFPWIRERIEAKALSIHGWYFDMATGELWSYLSETGTFEVLVARCPA